jgi:putative inorganic carbon (HCO3(-)) transporter
MWKGAVRIIKANPILGTGLASFPVVYEKYKEASHTEFFPNPDELYLTLWIEMGLLGLLAFVWLMVKFFKTGLSLAKSLRTTDYGLPMAVGLMAAMVALLVHGFFDTPYFKNDLAVVFWTFVGLLVVLPRVAEKDTTPLHITEH